MTQALYAHMNNKTTTTTKRMKEFQILAKHPLPLWVFPSFFS
jgi:hypothetical protein